MIEGVHKHRFSNGSIQGFDDLYIKQQYHLQQKYGQHVPLTLDGGREVLWWCKHCRFAWYGRGRRGAVLHLSLAQVQKIAHSLHFDAKDIRGLPQALCPACVATDLGGVPHIEEYHGGYGYRFTWERAKSPAQFLCAVYSGSLLHKADLLQSALSSASDLPFSSPTQERQVLHWLTRIQSPTWHKVVPLDSTHCELLNRQHPPASGLGWCGYAWDYPLSPLGRVVIIVGVTFYLDARCSPEILLACWRQIANAMSHIL